MKTIKSFLLVLALFSVSLFSRQAHGQDTPQTPVASTSSRQVTVTETTQEDGTLVETIQIIGTLDLEYHSMVDFQGYLPDIVAPTIILPFGQKMILKICPQNNEENHYFYFFHFHPKSNGLSVLNPEIGKTSLLKRQWMTEPSFNGAWTEYCKIWNTEKTGNDVLSFTTAVTYSSALVQNCWKYKLRLQVPVIVVDP